MSKVKIIHRSSVLAGQAVEVESGRVVFGRDPSTCTVLFDEDADRVVSREHAELAWNGDTLVMAPRPGKVLLRGGVVLPGPVSVRPGDIFEFAGPGGPSVEVDYDPFAFGVGPNTLQSPDFARVLPRLSRIESEAPTRLQFKAPEQEPPAVVLPSPVPAPLPSEPNARRTPQAPPRDSFAPPAIPSPSHSARTPTHRNTPQPLAGLEPKNETAPIAPNGFAKPPTGPSTMVMPVLSVDDEPETAFEMPPVGTPEPPRPIERALLWTTLITALVLLVGAAGWHLYSTTSARARAQERVRRLTGYFEESRASEQSGAKNRTVSTSPAASPTRSSRAESLRTSPPAENESTRPEPQDPRRTEAQAAFSSLKRLELERLTLSHARTPESRTERAALDTRMRAARANYVKLADSLDERPHPSLPDDRRRAVLLAARHLGECDATLPESLLEQALARAQALATTDRDTLIRPLSRAKARRYAPTLTAALADEGLPVEFFFLPQLLSGFDEQLVREGGNTRGMWQLSTEVATRLGLKVVGASSADAPTDERHQHEREARAAARAISELYRGPGAASALLVMALWTNGDASGLEKAKLGAQIDPLDADPARVSLATLWEKNALGHARTRAVDLLATAAVFVNPDAFGLELPLAIRHVEPEERR